MASKKKLALEAIGGALPKLREATAAQLEKLGPNAGYRVTDSGRIVSCARVNNKHVLSWLDPNADKRVVLEGLPIEPGVPRASPDGKYVVLGEVANRRIVEVELDKGEGRTIYAYNSSWSTFYGIDYVSSDVLAYLWGSTELWVLFRLPSGAWELSADGLGIASTQCAIEKWKPGLSAFLGTYLLLAPQKQDDPHQVIAVHRRNVAVLGKLDVDSDVVEVRDGKPIVAKGGAAFEITGLEQKLDTRMPISASPHFAPVVFDPLVPAGSPLVNAQRVYATTRSGRMLGWIDAKLAWVGTDGATEFVEMVGSTFERGCAHPTDERAIIYAGTSWETQQPYDITFGTGARLVADVPGTRAAFAGPNAIATLAAGTLRLLDETGRERASLPCPDHDRVFGVQFGKTILTSGPKGCAAGPRIYEVGDGLVFRSDVTVDVKAMSDAPQKASALRAEKGRIVDVRDVVERDGHYFIAGTPAQGNFVLTGL